MTNAKTPNRINTQTNPNNDLKNKSSHTPKLRPHTDRPSRYSELEKTILIEFEDVISDSLKHKRMGVAPAEIYFKAGIKIKSLHVTIARPLPLHMKAEADKTLKKYIDEGIIQPVNHPQRGYHPHFGSQNKITSQFV